MKESTTIGYGKATVASFLEALTSAGVDLVVDVRALANSRRPGFAKNSLAANLAGVGIDYMHLRGLGTPAEGRAAARAGKHDHLRSVYASHLRDPVARADLDVLAGLVRQGRRVCLLCLEEDPRHCHRSLVAEALGELIPIEVEHLHPGATTVGDDD